MKEDTQINEFTAIVLHDLDIRSGEDRCNVTGRGNLWLVVVLRRRWLSVKTKFSANRLLRI